MGRPILMQMDLRLLPWQICMLPRHLFLSHTQMKQRIRYLKRVLDATSNQGLLQLQSDIEGRNHISPLQMV